VGLVSVDWFMKGKIMCNRRVLPTLAFGLLFAIGCSTSDQPAAKAASPPLPAVNMGSIKSDRFVIVQSLRGDTLTVSLDTDLPDFTEVMVSVSRSYFEKNSTDELARTYFEEKSTVGGWRQPRQIKISHDTFKTKLQEQQRKTAEVGIGGELERIEADVVIHFTVPMFQSNAAFGNRNSNLTGSAMTTSGNGRIVTSEVSVRYPLDAKATAGPQWANRNELVVGRTYLLSRETPLMAELNPADFDAQVSVIASRRSIPANGSITIKKVTAKDGGQWYQVEAHDTRTATIGTGWVNADALIGQQIQVDGKR
jgi:hypothetical protein